LPDRPEGWQLAGDGLSVTETKGQT
jgi:hypothetical protein